MMAIKIIWLLTPSQSRFYWDNASCFLNLTFKLYNVSRFKTLKCDGLWNGYLKFIDMGICKKINHKTARKTFTIIGTPNYMAP